MMSLIIAIHIIICILLIAIILVQRGRGGGLVESLSGVESMFGTKTTSFLSRITTVLSILFFLTCLSLAVLSARQSRSLIRDTKEEAVKESPAVQEAPVPQVAAPEEKKEEAVKEEPAAEKAAEKGAGN